MKFSNHNLRNLIIKNIIRITNLFLIISNYIILQSKNDKTEIFLLKSIC